MDIPQLYRLFIQHPHITTDSRKCQPGSIFFALKGDNFNGNLFADFALQSGCAYAIIDEPQPEINPRKILVENALQTLQALARHHRNQFHIPIIGITGTNGKTTTKELTAACLQKKHNVLATVGNLNNHIGVPLTLLQLTAQHTIAVIEMGANHPGEIKTLVEIALPTDLLITNVGKAHLEGFGSFEGVIATKCEMYDYARTHSKHLFVDGDNTLLLPQASGISQTIYGTSKGAYMQGRIAQCSPYLATELTHEKSNIEAKTHLIGSYNLTNVLAAATIARYFGVEMAEIAKALEEYTPENKRSQMKQTSDNTLIIDTYNANPTSMSAALDNFAHITAEKKAVILGDMRELGNESQQEHQHIIDKLQTMQLDTVLLAGREFLSTAPPFTTFGTTEQLLNQLKEKPLKGYCILIKASRGMQLEQTIELL